VPGQLQAKLKVLFPELITELVKRLGKGSKNSDAI
jgi:hypothetical protein